MEDKYRFARIAYEAYAAFTGGKTFDGRGMPTWDDLPERIRDAWGAATEASCKAMVPVALHLLANDLQASA